MLNTEEAKFAQELSARVRTLRLRHALSQQELADNAELTRSVVANLERGVTLPRPSTIRKIAQAFGLTLSQLTTPWPDE
jgi:transcriptional regulator with XRE-family HTH domain